VLQTQEIERVGGSPTIKLDIRVITATHRDLKTMVDEGKFREDLWFRINAFPIHIPPLRRRTEDIPLLVTHFIQKKSREFGISPPQVAPGALRRLASQRWPGNVRELENTVERVLIQHRHGPIHFHRAVEKEVAAPPALSLEGDRKIRTLNQVVRGHIETALGLSKGKVNGPDGAAASLDVHPNTLRKRMQKLGIAYGRKHRNMWLGPTR
jgi:transcriptional regulator with GAF, ATPase, and Fis domain